MLVLCASSKELLADSTTLPGTDIALTSSEHDGVVSAEVSTLLHASYPTVAQALVSVENWCQFMPLHFNIKGCIYQKTPQGDTLTLFSGRKEYQTTEASYPLTYHFKVTQNDATHLGLQLQAEQGPAGTKDYRILVDAQQAPEGVRLHIHSSYRPSLISSLLTRSYLSTLGRDKIGFTTVVAKGERHPVQGVRGVIERNIVRYQLAIDAFLLTASLPPGKRHIAAMHYWFIQNEKYKRQLHEMGEDEYILIKRKEWANQLRMQQPLNDKQPLIALQ